MRPNAVFMISSFLLLYCMGTGVAQWTDLPGGGKKNPTYGSSERTMLGLREALKKGSELAVSSVSKKDGYLANRAIRITLPEKMKKMEQIIRAAGYGRELDEFEESMNRAAENAAPRALDILKKAVSEITFSDAKKILKGGDTAATEYFRERTWSRLFESFRPAVNASMERVGVTARYLSLQEQTKNIPFAGSIVMDLDDYVTKGALDGLFLMLGREERRIRTDPKARTTELLRDIFGK